MAPEGSTAVNLQSGNLLAKYESSAPAPKPTQSYVSGWWQLRKNPFKLKIQSLMNRSQFLLLLLIARGLLVKNGFEFFLVHVAIVPVSGQALLFLPRALFFIFFIRFVIQLF
jgi:hypothetical protein